MKMISIRVQGDLLEQFESACKKNYTNKSEVLRQAMVEYVRKNQNEENDVEELLSKGYTVYIVQMSKGTDNTWDETAKPKIKLVTLDKQEALDFFETLPKWEDTEEPEYDNNGLQKYWMPVVVETTAYDKNIIRQ
jgi:Arc/MetJ-type ribon-helix-helix transcriptional regulator